MDSKWLYRGTILAASLFLCACARDVASPGASNTTARPGAVAVGGTYLVGFASTSVPDGFAGAVSALGGTVSSVHAAAGIAVVSGLSSATAAQLARVSGVAEVRPDVEIALDTPVPAAESGLDAPGIESQANPATAARYVWQWNMRAIKANQGWAAGKLGSSDVTVAILDTGIDYDAPDLNGLVDLSRSASFITSDDSLTHTFFPTRNTINDYNGHGTNVATQVSSKAVALAGVTSRTQLIGVKVLAASGRGSLSSVLDGVVWAAEHGADVANMSLGGGFAKAGLGAYVGLIARTFNYAQSKGMLVVVAAGNEEEDLDHNGNELKTYCGVPNVLCVSSVGPALATGPVTNPEMTSIFNQ